MKLTTATLVATLIASSAWFAAAQRTEGGGGERQRGGGARVIPIHKCLDKDGDGALSAEEIKNATAALLTLDKDKDGKLSAEEIAPTGGRGRGGDRAGGGRQRGGDASGRPQRPATEKTPTSDSE